METSGLGPEGAIRGPDLAEVAGDQGPFLTVYLPTDPEVDNAAQLSQTRWRNLRKALEEEQGADPTALQAVDAVVPDAHTRGRCLAAVATADGIRLVEYGPEPAQTFARWASLPRLAPVIEWRQTSPPLVVVLTDRTGADVYAFRREGPDVHREASGDEQPISRVKPGGWSQRRFQERAENTWDRNADEVAKVAVRLAEQVRARLLVAVGETRALHLLRDALPQEMQNILEILPGERWEGRSVDELRDEISQVVRSAADRDTASLLQTWSEEAGRADRAVDGPEETLRALSRSQVELLLVHDDAEDRRWAWFGPDPTQISTDLKDLRATGVEAPSEGRLVDVLIRAALGTGAGVRIVPREGGPSEGVGALLRWSA